MTNAINTIPTTLEFEAAIYAVQAACPELTAEVRKAFCDLTTAITYTAIDKINGIASHLLATFGAPETTDTASDEADFCNAFEKLAKAQGERYARICTMRRTLGWSTERFDTLLCKLRKDGTIQLTGGDPMNFPAEDLPLGFTDEFGEKYMTLIWRRG